VQHAFKGRPDPAHTGFAPPFRFYGTEVRATRRASSHSLTRESAVALRTSLTNSARWPLGSGVSERSARSSASASVAFPLYGESRRQRPNSATAAAKRKSLAISPPPSELGIARTSSLLAADSGCL